MNINFIDVGCSGYIPFPWDKNNYGKYINNIIGFDFLNHELNYFDKEFPNNRVYKYIIFDKEEKRDFYICKRNRVSSLFKPNIPLLILYIKYLNKIRSPKKYYISKYEIEETKKVKCNRLDKVLDTFDISFDFLKTDTEGADFQVIKSLGKYLDNDIVAIHSELYLKEMYKGVTLFKEVDKFLVEHGFYLAKNLGGVDNYWANFLYIREDNLKKDKVDLIKKAYQITDGKYNIK